MLLANPALRDIMNIKHLAPLFFISCILYGCDSQTPIESCSSPDTQKLISQLITEKTEKLTANKKFDAYGGAFELGTSQIHDSLAQVQIAVRNIRPATQGQKSSKELCSGLLQVTIPVTVLADADNKRNILHETTIAQYAKHYNIASNSNIFTQDIEYKVHSTSKGSPQHVELKSDEWVHLLDEIITASLFNPPQNETDQAQLSENNIQKNELVKPTAEEKQKVKVVGILQDPKGLEKVSNEPHKKEQPKEELHQLIPTHKVAKVLQVPVSTVKQITPSFDCAKASMPADIKICSSSDLAALDVKNRGLYKKAKTIDDKATKIILSESIKLKFSCGTNSSCIAKSYKQSIKSYQCVAAGNKKNCVNAAAPKKPRIKV